MADPKPQMTAEQMQRLADQQKKFNDEALNTEAILDSISKLLGDELKDLRNSTEATRELNTALGQGVDITKKLNKQIFDSGIRIEELEFKRSKNLAALAKARKKEDKDALIDANLKIDAQLKIEGLIRGQLELLKKHIEEEKKITEERKKQTNLLEIGKKYYKDNIASSLTLLGILKLLASAILKSDEQTTALAKSFGVTKSAAYDIRQNMVAFSRASESAFINVDRLFKAQQDLTEQLGIAVDFGGKEQEQFARLTEIVGLSADEAGKLAKFSAATGKSTDNYVASIRKAVFFSERANNIHVSDKKILSDISKLSAGILVKFQGNPKAIAEAVVQATKLGTTLEQMDKTAESLLNWESSIENELQAELITGRQLNFERARAAALTGSQAELMQEMANQAGSLAEFQNMNVIAQQSLAQAFGMSRDEMAEMLMKQEAINKYGSEAAKMNAKQLEDFEKSGLSLEKYLEKQDKQRSIQEKFNDALSKMQDLVANLVAGPFGRLLDIIVSITERTWLLAGIIGGAMVQSLIKMAKAAKIAKAASIGEAIANIWSAAFKSLGGWPGIGLTLAAAGAAAGVAALYSATKSTKEGNDVISPGYGKRMIFSPEGAVALNDNDTIIAGTNLGGGSSNAGVMNAINNLAASIQKQPAPQFSLNVDGEKLGQVTGRQQSTGTEQIKNSYRLA